MTTSVLEIIKNALDILYLQPKYFNDTFNDFILERKELAAIEYSIEQLERSMNG